MYGSIVHSIAESTTFKEECPPIAVSIGEEQLERNASGASSNNRKFERISFWIFPTSSTTLDTIDWEQPQQQKHQRLWKSRAGDRSKQR